MQLSRTKSSNEIQKVSNNNRNNNNDENYTIFQNPNHGELPDYASVLKKQPIQQQKRFQHEQEEESIFNLGKSKPKANPVLIDNNEYEEKMNDQLRNDICNYFLDLLYTKFFRHG